MQTRATSVRGLSKILQVMMTTTTTARPLSLVTSGLWFRSSSILGMQVGEAEEEALPSHSFDDLEALVRLDNMLGTSVSRNLQGFDCKCINIYIYIFHFSLFEYCQRRERPHERS